MQQLAAAERRVAVTLEVQRDGDVVHQRRGLVKIRVEIVAAGSGREFAGNTDTREGMHMGTWQCALRNDSPRLASRSMLGVFASGWPPRQPIQSLRSSIAMKTTFGLAGAAAVTTTPSSRHKLRVMRVFMLFEYLVFDFIACLYCRSSVVQSISGRCIRFRCPTPIHHELVAGFFNPVDLCTFTVALSVLWVDAKPAGGCPRSRAGSWRGPVLALRRTTALSHAAKARRPCRSPTPPGRWRSLLPLAETKLDQIITSVPFFIRWRNGPSLT